MKALRPYLNLGRNGLRTLFLLMLTLNVPTAWAEDETPTTTPPPPVITIAGDVYGGGKQGAVGTGNTTATAETDVEAVTLDGNAPKDVTHVEINSGTVRTVFGGGENGRTYGNTKVEVAGKNAVIGDASLVGTIHGGLFGGGDGVSAHVFGGSTVEVKAGTILQKIYGGGNQADLMGSTSVHLTGGDIRSPGVYAGARMANIYGYTYAFVDGANMTDNLIVNALYGGNDVSGNIAPSSKWAWTDETESATLPTGFDPITDGVDKFQAFIRTTKEKAPASGETQKYIFIGNLFGGGDGSDTYNYQPVTNEAGTLTGYTVQLKEKKADGSEELKTFNVFSKPLLESTYLELQGGTFGNVYGGGNNATITGSTVICIDNQMESEPLIAKVSTSSSTDDDDGVIVKSDRLTDMGINPVFYENRCQFAQVFGGNNLADMAIRPKWNLLRGSINNLYSGGNLGAMTHPNGIYLPINSPNIEIYNVYGGCRMADVNPAGNTITEETMPDGTVFPAGYAARVKVTAGQITNVYGGNDVSGNVYGGNAIGIHSSIIGNVYGGGNGSYPYSDNTRLLKNPRYKDFVFNVPTGKSVIEALNAFRPNAESVSIRVLGTDAAHPTIIGGAIYCGGNSATLRNDTPGKNAAAELKIGSHVYADKVFLGNNGEYMKNSDDDADDDDKDGVLRKYAGFVDENGDWASTGSKFISVDMEDDNIFKEYMDGVAMKIKPQVAFDDEYLQYSTYFGSFFCGGNVGSMIINGEIDIDFNGKVVIFDKVVGGSNDANVQAVEDINGQYLGGLLGTKASTGNKLVLNFNGLKIQPKRWKDVDDKSKLLVWNTIKASTEQPVPAVDADPVNATSTTHPFEASSDLDRRFKGGNIYGGCYNSGHVNGNVVINLDASIVDRKGDNAIFDQVEEVEGEAKLYGINLDELKITRRCTGVLLSQQGMDPLGRALNVFGGGYGVESEIWGSTTVNLNAGYTFQIFGGGEQGAIGQADNTGEYTYNPAYSCYINLKGTDPGVYRGHADDSDNMAECEFIYGGSFEGLIAGNTRINLGNGRIFNSFAGSCNADILGHTETYVGRNSNDDNDLGFPWIRDHIYGGNDLGGHIWGNGDISSLDCTVGTHADCDFKNRVAASTLQKVYNPKSQTNPDVLKASAYTEYVQGRVEYIFGGCYGDYDYSDSHYSKYTYTKGEANIPDGSEPGSPREGTGFIKPRMDNAFVYFRPTQNNSNDVKRIYGAGQGHSMELDRDVMQDRSYVLIDIPDGVTKFNSLEVFGAGDFSGVGMGVAQAVAKTNANGVTAAAVIDLVSGNIKDVYGASNKEGITRRTIVNVPEGSSVNLHSIYGGALGINLTSPCDAYEATVNYKSEGARVSGAIYGGNNAYRRTLYGTVNVTVPVWQNPATGYLATVYGAGFGENTWSQYTEVNLTDRAKVYEVYGGGQNGKVLNTPSVAAWKSAAAAQTTSPFNLYTDLGTYVDNGLNNDLARAINNPLVPEINGKKFNTRIHIGKGAHVENYCYGGGLGDKDIAGSGDVYGTTYIELVGGLVKKDLYGAGTQGAVVNKYQVAKDDFGNDFMASANVFIGGGMVRNVYGGGWAGNVGYHEGVTIDGKYIPTAGPITNDIPGETNVYIGVREDQDLPAGTVLDFYMGDPAIQRNAFGGGEGGAVFGTSHISINNGHIGFTYEQLKKQNDNGTEELLVDTQGKPVMGYVEKVHDETWTDHVGENRLYGCGNVFGGGYDDNSSVDHTNVYIWGGLIRNSVYGGGEIATVGRGKTKEEGAKRTLEAIYKAGSTFVEMYNGKVWRNMFGGGKGYNILGYGGENKYYTDGYVFGHTEIHIHGGDVGTDEGVDSDHDGFGNVFGGGDLGYVYSGSLVNGIPTVREGTGSPDHYYYKDANGELTEDCKVLIAPMLQLRKGQTLTGFPDPNNPSKTSYGSYEYVHSYYLNTLKKDAAEWQKFYTGDKLSNGSINPDDPVERGIHIYNAVFAGGNVSSNDDTHYRNEKTVFGNSTATIYDIYHRDFITIGTEHIGGIYGCGNRSKVDGYRELNITNYGTDYYGMDEQITYEKYLTLTNRERAYFKLEYQCQQSCTDIKGKEYEAGDRISEDDYEDLIPDEQKDEAGTYWKQYGFCSIYAGRLLNTIQRADFCGVYGSRMVLQGAKDREDPSDGNPYTINRVGELSLNQQRSLAGDTDANSQIHGNYFGIYSNVKYLGNLTSDVHFDDKYRKMLNNEAVEVNNDTYYHWKTENLGKRERNNGTAYNQVALASGVFLELITEQTELNPDKQKEYGYVTGVVELDLINVKRDIEGGGYVYARNEHRVPMYYPKKKNVLLSEYNKENKQVFNGQEMRDEAITHRRFFYENSGLPTGTEASNSSVVGQNMDASLVAFSTKDYQTSGNFIHKSKRIVDDCYPNNADVNSPAHYWFIKGEVYIYDQLVTGYAGSASAYSKEVYLPLTITAGSKGRLKLLNVNPNVYAYYSSYNSENDKVKMGDDGVKVDNDRVTYHLNDVVSWWDWHQLTDNEQKLFVKETYVNVDTCWVDGTLYPKGTYALEHDLSLHAEAQTDYAKFLATNPTVVDKHGETVTNISDMFRISNNISHSTGFVLTYDMDSPSDWADWYSPKEGSSLAGKKKKAEYDNLNKADQDKYREGPTFRLNPEEDSGLFGQRRYEQGETLPYEVWYDYTTTVSQMTEAEKQALDQQAVVEEAYVALNDCPVGGVTVQAGNPIGVSAYNGLGSAQSNFEKALVCINTIQLDEKDYVFVGELVANDVNKTALKALAAKYRAYNNAKTTVAQITEQQALAYIEEHFSQAYYCKEAGNYGGQYYQTGQNYSALKSWCALPGDRTKFEYNYDALDVLVDETYPGEGHTAVYDWPGTSTPIYSAEKPVDYVAKYTGGATGTKTLTYTDLNGDEQTLTKDSPAISREEYESCIKNEQCHYTRVEIVANQQVAYFAKENFYNSGTPYGYGQDLTEREYNSLTTANKAKVEVVTLPSAQTHTESTAKVWYYCYEAYDNVQKGTFIDATDFGNLDNYQRDFTIQGSEPTETTTLYVAKDSDPKNLTEEKIITVIYQYTYYEDDQDGEGVSQTNELHVVNIHLQLESGAPEIGPLSVPPAVLPGEKVGLKPPTVKPCYEDPITNGWLLFENEDDAINHREHKAKPFVNNDTPLYWFQDQNAWVVFYSQTSIGKTFSNAVPLTVANYHDLKKVLEDADHLFIDYDPLKLQRDCKVYINDYSQDETGGKNGLDMLNELMDLTYGKLGAVTKYGAFDTPENIQGANNLDIILSTNLDHTGTEWTPLASGTDECFEGQLHGDGYTITGLDHSLINNLCGDVYNLGVTGSFTSAGVADTGKGYVENCWINTSAGSVSTDTHAVFGNPTRTDASKPIQVVNCYYPNTKGYDQTTSEHGNATPMPEKAFYNGTVAYNLNGFYLNKRYYQDEGLTTGTKYSYFQTNADGTLPEDRPMTEAYYPATYDVKNGSLGYVEDRYGNVDFIYAGGSVPETVEPRMRTKTEGNKTVAVYAPIWPDDYIYFGQQLTYNYDDEHQHEEQPSHIVKSGGRLTIDKSSNRVYRAPAYFGDRNLSVVHFNPAVNLAAYSKPLNTQDTNLKEAYPGMTAIDFKGHQDVARYAGLSNGVFFPPLLDDAGLESINNRDETTNLLVYAPAETDNQKTYDVLTGYFVNPAYSNYDDETSTYYTDLKPYKRVYTAPSSTVVGHLVLSNLTTNCDHLLVDKQDFNCPIGYTMGENYRMWYQRMPDTYVGEKKTLDANGDVKYERDMKAGWEAVSLPFAAKRVTTPVKGELTHFYGTSLKGHEYWLREYTDINDGDDDKKIAKFTYPAEKTGYDLPYTNTFLWDYYYERWNSKDKNRDDYQDYYNESHTYENYPISKAGTPYLIGFPGQYFYEFDLSGKFSAQNTDGVNLNEVVPQVPAQPIIFVSDKHVSIGVSDNERTEKSVKYGNFSFVPNYQKRTIAAETGYLLAADGTEFSKNLTVATALPFRPYFTTSAGNARTTRSIVFGNEFSELKGNEDHDQNVTGTLSIYPGRKKIIVESSLRWPADVRIVNPAGITVNTFTIQPGETIETRVNFSGVFIVQTEDGEYTKKLLVK